MWDLALSTHMERSKKGFRFYVYGFNYNSAALFSCLFIQIVMEEELKTCLVVPTLFPASSQISSHNKHSNLFFFFNLILYLLKKIRLQSFWRFFFFLFFSFVINLLSLFWLYKRLKTWKLHIWGTPFIKALIGMHKCLIY